MLRETTLWVSRDHKTALRREAQSRGLQTPDEALEAVLVEWIKEKRPALAEWLTDRAEALAAVDRKHQIGD